MTLQEMADKLGLKSPDSLRRQIGRGVLTAEKVGTGPHAIWLVSEEAYERYVLERRGKRGFAAESHPLHGKGRPRRRDT
jgi:hypothetical protein